QALEGSQLERQGNDIVAVVLPSAPAAGQQLRLRMTYGGDVLADAGGGLLYVGARGIWYPNRGLDMSDFDMNFRYPPEWTLLATGKREGEIHTVQVPGSPAPMQDAKWVSERPIPFAGFNLGRYVKAEARAGSTVIESFAAHGMENTFRKPQTVLVLPGVRPGSGERESVVVSDAPTPASNAQMVANNGAQAVEFLSQRLGPFPFSSLHLTQMPGNVSQGWPGLIYLSSYVFLSPEELARLRLQSFGTLMFGHLMEPHEIGHQWWGDLMLWKSYREQWLVEALSNYCALAMIEGRDPTDYRAALDYYRQQLLTKNKSGVEFAQAGPVTLGVRLNSSRFPDAYNTISYGRGTWLFHMLREMLLNPGPAKGAQAGSATAEPKRGSPDEPFFRVLRKVRQRYEGREITTRDLQQAFEEELPPQLWYEGRKSLDWFFDGWVNGISIPRFELADVKFRTTATGTVATGKIIQKDSAEDLVTSLPLYASSGATNTMLGRIFVESAETPFRFTVPRGTKKILIDPYGTVLRREQ
ncbi:MAG TPA: M1 family aminopeptidase, partial [Terriglobales bacterium]|nr:M1 family aminopeptidase [Terriglobales bacterium]